MRCLISVLTLFPFVIGFLALGADAAVLEQGGPDIPSFIGYATDRIVINFDPSVRNRINKGVLNRGRTGIPELDQVAARFGATFIRPQFPGAKIKSYHGRAIDLAGWHKVKYAGKVDISSVVRAYKALPGVIDAQPVSIHKVHATPIEQFYDLQWHLPKIAAPEAWDEETGSGNIIVAMLDTGVRYFQKDLGGAAASPSNPTDVNGNMWINWAEKGGSAGDDDDRNGYVDDWVGWDFVEDTYDPLFICYPSDLLFIGEEGEDCATADNDPRDFNGHGTHCAGNVSAMNNNGEAVASVAGGWGDGTLSQFGNGVKVMPLKIGWSAIYFLWEVGVVAMDYAAEALYYAADNGAKIASCSWGSANTGGIAAAINYFTASGGLIFKAAGNDGTESADYMCSRSDIISVAATDENDCKAYFSTHGSWVDISAPGVNIWSLYHDHYDPDQDYVGPMDGTSMATPLAASVAALIWSQNPSWSADQVKQRLFDSAYPIDNLPCNSTFSGKLGAGRIDAFQAVYSEAPVPPDAAFVANPTSGTAPLTVQFEDQSTGSIGSCTWDFGDGSELSSEQHPSHTYHDPGSYTVSLTVTGPAGRDVETKTGYITVNAPTQQQEIGVVTFESGKYRGKGKNKSFRPIDIFGAGDEIIFRADVKDTSADAVPGAIVKITITGPETHSLTSEPSDNNGLAEAKWKTVASKKKRNGTSIGSYTAIVIDVTAEGYEWDGSPSQIPFEIE
jgi:subtilisin family serine protease